MSQRISRSSKTPKREGLSWEERWKGRDKGLITCWEVGKNWAQAKPELALRARDGELPVLGWKGGVEKKTQKKKKFGSLLYLAMWQGLRGEDLDIDMSQETQLICSRTGMKVVYTPDVSKYANA